MHNKSFVTGLFVMMLGACNQSADTHLAKEVDTLRCMRQNEGMSDYELEVLCVTLKKSAKYSGTWFVDFEQSIFINDYLQEPAILIRSNHIADIIVPESISSLMRVRPGSERSAYQVNFVGRESQLSGSTGNPVIIMDKLISVRKVARAPDSLEPVQSSASAKQTRQP